MRQLELLLKLPQFGPHALADRFASHGKSGSPFPSVCDAPCCLHPAPKISAFGATMFRGYFAFLSLRPDDLLTILKMALSIDLRDSVSLLPSIQATRF